jgi:hypothetical protein
MQSLIEYIKIHAISLEQDLDEATEIQHTDYLEGCIDTTQHLLSVADDILMSSNFDDIHYSGGIH